MGGGRGDVHQAVTRHFWSVFTFFALLAFLSHWIFISFEVIR